MPHDMVFHKSLHSMLRLKVIICREKLQFYLESLTCDTLIYTMDHSKLIASIEKEDFYSAFYDFSD